MAWNSGSVLVESADDIVLFTYEGSTPILCIGNFQVSLSPVAEDPDTLGKIATKLDTVMPEYIDAIVHYAKAKQGSELAKAAVKFVAGR